MNKDKPSVVTLKRSTEDLGEILASETLHITGMFFNADKKKKSIDRQYWAWLHLGFIAALKLHGYTDKECDEALAKCQSELEEHDNNPEKYHATN